jgi:hypothetical protein
MLHREVKRIKEARVPIILDLVFNNIGDAGVGFFAQSLKEARIPVALDLVGANKIGMAGLDLFAAAQEDNFIIEARSDPSEFLSRIKFSMAWKC